MCAWAMGATYSCSIVANSSVQCVALYSSSRSCTYVGGIVLRPPTTAVYFVTSIVQYVFDFQAARNCDPRRRLPFLLMS